MLRLRSQSRFGQSVFDEGRVQAGDMPGEVLCRAQSRLAAALLPGQGRDRLLDQRGLPVGGRLDDPQVARLDAVFIESYGRPEDRKCLRSVRPGAADEAVILKLGEYGIQPRHLRVIKAAADRETALVEQAVAPLARQKGSREPALRAAQDISGHISRLHATLVEDGLTEAGLASQPPQTGTSGGESREAPGLRSASGR